MNEVTGYESNAFLTDAWLRVRGKPEEGNLIFRKNVDTELELSLDQPTTEKIIDIGRRCPRLANWEMFAITDVAVALDPFRQRLTSHRKKGCGAKGFQTTSHSNPPVASF
jgi:hypothetical protein